MDSAPKPNVASCCVHFRRNATNISETVPVWIIYKRLLQSVSTIYQNYCKYTHVIDIRSCDFRISPCMTTTKKRPALNPINDNFQCSGSSFIQQTNKQRTLFVFHPSILRNSVVHNGVNESFPAKTKPQCVDGAAYTTTFMCTYSCTHHMRLLYSSMLYCALQTHTQKHTHSLLQHTFVYQHTKPPAARVSAVARRTSWHAVANMIL